MLSSTRKSRAVQTNLLNLKVLYQCLAASTWWWCPRPSSERWAEMARQLSWGVWPSSHSQSSKTASFFRLADLWTGHSWTITRLISLDRTLFCSPTFLISSYSSFYLLVVMFCNTPALSLFTQQNPNIHALSAPGEVGRTSIQCSHCKRWGHSTCSRFPGPAL